MHQQSRRHYSSCRNFHQLANWNFAGEHDQRNVPIYSQEIAPLETQKVTPKRSICTQSTRTQTFALSLKNLNFRVDSTTKAARPECEQEK